MAYRNYVILRATSTEESLRGRGFKSNELFEAMELFEKIRPDLLDRIRELSLKHNLSLFDKIRKEKDASNLKSLLTESHFGIYFDTFSSSIRYNYKYFPESNATPDYVITANGQEIIIEVCRVNPAQTDTEIQESEDAAIMKFQQENPGILVIGGFHRITYRPNKLMGENGSIALKAAKYGPLAESAGRPVIICIYLDLVSGHNALDLYHSLYGSSANYIGAFPMEGYYPNAPFHHFGNALYYKNEQMRKNISGVLLRNNEGEFVYYHNFSAENRLNNMNRNYFSAMQYTCR